jgi:phage shock protein PspC (stress-responsive transcriptional regulator)
MDEEFPIKNIKVGAKPFSRPRDDRIILGVCSGLARKLRITSTTSRVIFSLLTLFTGGTLALVYLVIFLISPQE